VGQPFFLSPVDPLQVDYVRQHRIMEGLPQTVNRKLTPYKRVSEKTTYQQSVNRVNLHTQSLQVNLLREEGPVR
jgi:hypothetical protein